MVLLKSTCCSRLSVREVLPHSRSWMEGIRKPYVAPFQLFLLANVLFFALSG
ncbi:DUF3667 domain-containing protein [Variovorax humicola]|uniref:DUF3667 domain-containing protein n=1 Tax=Variovorax humicola TaxID=1769758 RepID=UPI003BF46DA5